MFLKYLTPPCTSREGASVTNFNYDQFQNQLSFWGDLKQKRSNSLRLPWEVTYPLPTRAPLNNPQLHSFDPTNKTSIAMETPWFLVHLYFAANCFHLPRFFMDHEGTPQKTKRISPENQWLVQTNSFVFGGFSIRGIHPFQSSSQVTASRKGTQRRDVVWAAHHFWIGCWINLAILKRLEIHEKKTRQVLPWSLT